MKAETEALLQECRTALLQHSDERIAALLAQWFESLIGEEYLDEERDDLCLLLDFRVQSWGAPASYATYTSWWEVEGYLEPTGSFTCADLAALRQRLLDLPLSQFDVIVEMAYQARLALKDSTNGPPLPTGRAALQDMVAWLEQAAPASPGPELQATPPAYTRFESKEQQRKHEEERAAQACQQGYLVLSPASSHIVTDAFREWCKKQKQPFILIEPRGKLHAFLRIQTKTADIRAINAVMSSFQAQLPAVVAPYLARAQERGQPASLAWISKPQAILEGLLAEDAQAAARAIVALWSTIVAEEKQREIEHEAERQAALISMWKRELTRLSAQETLPQVPPLSAEVVLPASWEDLLTREHLSAFLAYLKLPVTTRETKPVLTQRLQEHLDANPPARALFFEVFKRELAVPPWELETLLPCSPAERRRWTDEERLPILELRSFRKAGSEHSFPVFDRRVILTLPGSELARWRAEHQALVKEHRSTAARAAKKKEP